MCSCRLLKRKSHEYNLTAQSEPRAILDFDKSFHTNSHVHSHILLTPITTPGWSRLSRVYERTGASVTPFPRACWPSPLTQPGDSMTKHVSVIIRIIKGTPMGKLFSN